MTNNYWTLNIADGVRICVQPDVRLMTTYVLLEQEDWFEQELPFLRKLIKPGMGIIDIGANHGVYTLSLAKRLNGQGLVMAFEPATVPAALLQHSIQENNFNSVIKLYKLGLSDHDGQANLYIDTNSELNSLCKTSSANSTTETVRLTTLDALTKADAWPTQFAIDLIKLDAEGEEIRILNGGVQFFSEHDPLVMFEWKHGNIPNTGLLEAFSKLGMDCYRLIPGLSALIPVVFDEVLDSYQLNLFACKPSCAARLRANGYLLSTEDLTTSALPPVVTWPQVLEQLPYVAAVNPNGQTIQAWQAVDHGQNQLWQAYELALNAYLSSTKCLDQPLPQRWAWFKQSRMLLENLATAGSLHLVVLILHIRALYDEGLRTAAVELNSSLLKLLQTGLQARIDWPFLPLLAEYEQRSPQGLDAWLHAQIVESFEKHRSFSSYFINKGDDQWLEYISKNPNCSPEMERRRVLYALKNKKKTVLNSQSSLYRSLPTPEHRNAVWWKNVILDQSLKSIIKFFISDLKNSPIFVLDISAASFGQFTEPYAEIMQAGITQVLGFEPNLEQCEHLNKLYGRDARYRYLPQFVGSGKSATFYETNRSMTGSLFKPNTALLQRFENLDELVRLKDTHSVKTVKIADLSEIQDVDLIKIDVQGAELDVFQGAENRLNQVLVIWTEVEFVPLYENQPLFSEVELFLREKGFLLHSFDGIASRRFKKFSQSGSVAAVGRSQALWSDAIFVRDFRTLEQLSTLKLKKLAILLDQVVKSYDFCYEVLLLIDQRENKNYAKDYLLSLS